MLGWRRCVTCGPLSFLLRSRKRFSQIQSITDESRSSIRRKNQSGAHGSAVNNQNARLDDDKQDEVANPKTTELDHRSRPYADICVH